MAGTNWSDAENNLVVADYFEMLKLDLQGVSFNKAERYRSLTPLLADRSVKSVEAKHCNISAIMRILGEDIVTGLPPRFNFQMPLADMVYRYLNQLESQLQKPFSSTLLPTSNSRLLVREQPTLWIGSAPTFSNQPLPIDVELMETITRKYNVAERDERNRELGKAGEERVFMHEQANLRSQGRQDLAKQIKWTSQEEGDGAGYDISSFEPDGAPRLIEVKTTNGWDRTPFHISRNELAVADQNRDHWCLVRLWNFAREPKAFEIRPPLDAHVSLTPTTFLAAPH